MRNNYMKVGRPVECGHCNPKDFGEGLKLGEKMGLNCYCICHDECIKCGLLRRSHPLDACPDFVSGNRIEKDDMNENKLSTCCKYPTYAESGDCGKCGKKGITPFEKETIEMFDDEIVSLKDMIDMFGYEGTKEHIKSFLLSRLHALSTKHRKEIKEKITELFKSCDERENRVEITDVLSIINKIIKK
jgi:hypothetical protein